jgi:type IV pilus assembly protein PilX
LIGQFVRSQLSPQKSARGFVLVTSLIFLSVLSLLAAYAIKSSLFEERMASSDRDSALARENAELGLRDAERDVLGVRFDGAPNFCGSTPAPSPACANVRPVGTRPVSVADSLTFWTAGNSSVDDIASDDGGASVSTLASQGVYTVNSATACGMPVWSGANWVDGASPARSCTGTITTPVPTIAYGSFTNAPFPNGNGTSLAGVPPPRYIIEYFTGTDMRLANTSNKVFFRLTAVGFGRTVGVNGLRTSITLQTVFSPL